MHRWACSRCALPQATLPSCALSNPARMLHAAPPHVWLVKLQVLLTSSQDLVQPRCSWSIRMRISSGTAGGPGWQGMSWDRQRVAAQHRFRIACWLEASVGIPQVARGSNNRGCTTLQPTLDRAHPAGWGGCRSSGRPPCRGTRPSRRASPCSGAQHPAARQTGGEAGSVALQPDRQACRPFAASHTRLFSCLLNR